ncbi:ABC-type metal ion transport system, ATPase component [Schinkia azotoformans MEV2011]|uniref:ABC-type metal ion transport system, ATPase component n=1 Tax=Schinkia azotoformans MEV2011 TaxID=1348973 RepID=A0A072NF48_SCHAZ|nr:methionine ABC transporter ATP-binding protein [Schinkia azotoformans]KEF36334.1 ABC-type metal ion transport system, ATPase component [Schinkia azotoformans MEV2011]MEC1696726.1 methionine ABC transporter ATP-binding protein [Schinkia azotoformans]MEC1723620.1 methionine ABC transporter ATP-binding protein [Schinkia azotoformans]MEC1771080.1 methionine ABC transporter ATP-binding protein [Schinkia azotoformans]MEC1781850.1 methionine ABC transporter ATP-binding protein [Schinkia azotoforma
MIEVHNLVKSYHSKRGIVVGVDHVSLKIEKGEIFGIIGYSGAGKSSLLRCLNLLEKPTSGEVYVDQVELTSLNKAELRKARLKIGMIFQHFYLVSSKTVFENVAFALKAARKSKAEIQDRVLWLLEIVGLADKKDAFPSQLSGGQKQRVAIARALANEPNVLLCDEATSALDPTTTKAILKLLKKINEDLGLTIVLITHEMEVVKEICDKVAVMQSGKVIEEGTVYEVFANPKKDLTKEFINTILHFGLPDRLIANKKGKIVKIVFKGEVAEESIVSDMLQTFKIRGNILHGKIEYIKEVPLGIFIMEVTGESFEIERALGFIKKRVEVLEVFENAA